MAFINIINDINITNFINLNLSHYKKRIKWAPY